MQRRLVLIDGKSRKFWEVSVDGTDVTTRWGRLGTEGQEKTASYASNADAQQAAEKALAGKVKKGYVDVPLDATSARSNDTAVATSQPAKSGQRRPASGKAMHSRASNDDRRAEAVLPLAGEAAKRCRDLLDEALGQTGADAEKELRRGLYAVVTEVVADQRPHWLRLEEDLGEGLSEVAVDLTSPVCWARMHDDDEFYGGWHDTLPSPRLILQSSSAPWRGQISDDEDDETVLRYQEVIFGDEDVSRLTEFKDDDGLVCTVDFAGRRPRTLQEYVERARGLSRVLLNEVVILELSQGLMPSDAPHRFINERGPGRSGRYETEVPRAAPKVRWRAKQKGWGSQGGGTEFGGQPICAGDLYVSAEPLGRGVTAVTTRGSVEWASEQFRNGEWISGSLAAIGDTVVAASSKALYAFDLANGATRWRRSLARLDEGAVADDQLLYVPSKGVLHALNPGSGDSVWKWSRGKTKRVSAPIVCQDRLVVHVDGHLVALSRGTSAPQELWIATGHHEFPSRYGVVAGVDAVFIAVSNGIAAYDLATGKQRWFTECQATSLALEPDVLVATPCGRYEGSVVGLEPSDGKILYERKQNCGVPSVADGVCVCTATDSANRTSLVAFVARTGKRLWRISAKEIAQSGKSTNFPTTLSGFEIPLLDRGKVLLGVSGLWAYK